MVVPWICVSISKSQVIWRKPKKSRFLHFSVSLSKKNSSGRQSDTIEDWRLAHSSFWRLCSNFFKTHVEVSNTFKNMGVRPPQSQLIRICVPQKSCFLTTFCETQPPASIGWVALSSVVRRSSRIVTSPLISTIWCFRAYKPYIFCEDMILATCQCQHIFCCWVEHSLLLSSSFTFPDQVLHQKRNLCQNWCIYTKIL